MFFGCPEISVSVSVKHVPHIGIIRAFHLPWGTCYFFQCLGELLSSSVSGGTEKIAGLWLIKGDQYQG